MKKNKQVKKKSPSGAESAEAGRSIVIRWSLDRGVESVSPSIEEISGYRPDEIISNPGFLFRKIHPEDKTKLLDAFMKRLEKGNAGAPVEVRLLTASGAVKWMRAEIFPIKGETGGEVAVESVLTPIAGRATEEDRLHESEELYRTLLQTSPEAIAVITPDGSITEVSQRTLDVFGYENIEELFEKKALDLVVPEDRPKALKTIRGAVEKGFQKNIEFNLLKKDGARFIGELNAAAVKDTSGGPGAIILAVRDITSRKQSEQMLAASEERFRSIFEKAKTGMAIVSSANRFLKANRAFYEFLGYDESELIGLGVEDVTHPDDVESSRLLIEKTRKREIHGVDLEKRYVRKDGGIVWGHVNTTPFFNSEGKLIYSVALIQDITKRWKAEHDLRESEERYRTLAEAARDFIFVVGPDMKVQYVNSFGAMALGLKLEDVTGRPLTEIFPSETSNRQIQSLEKVFETGEPMCVENETNFRGRILWLDTWLVPLKNEEGKTIAVQGISRDTTERKKSEAALRESEHRYRTLFESSPDSITILGTDGRIIDMNGATGKLTGFPREMFVGRHFTEISTLNTGDMARYARIFAGIMRGENPGPIDVESANVNGEKICTEVHIAPLLKDGRLTAIQVIARDITERKRLEQAKINFLGSVSHELRTPLSLILGYSQLLLKEDLPPSVKKKLKIINERGRQELKLVEELITLAKFESGETSYKMSDVKIWNFLHSYMLQVKVMVESLVEKRFHTKVFTFAGEIADELKGAIVFCDEERIRQSLDNLVENAVKYSDRKNLEFKLSAALDGSEVVIAVTDKGMGIPKSEQEAIFKPFYQIREGRHPLSDGMGKGLSIVKEYIEAHQGKIWIESTPERGSTFFFSLPVKEILEHVETGAVRKILVVDDDRDIVEFIENLLTDEGFEVCVAFNRADTLDALKSETPDLVLLDVQLPDGDGVEICKKLKAEAECPTMLVFLISAKASEELKRMAGEAGADGFISKPFEIDSFLEMIDGVQ